MSLLPRLFPVVLLLALGWPPLLAQSLTGIVSGMVSDLPAGPNDCPVVSTDGKVSPVFFDAQEDPGIIRAIGDLQQDIERVTGRKPSLQTTWTSPPACIIIGSAEQSSMIRQLVSSGKLDVSDLSGKWESFVITTVEKPARGIEQALVIAGSDKRGTIYGIYELSRQLGVSPWYWWADVPPLQRESAYVKAGRYASGEPGVKYRGIFINDEEPAFGSWAREKFGGINSDMYTHMFELLLRLRANYLWPAMWGKSFSEDDPANPRLADEYGIVMGNSHHEPMLRAQKEWDLHRADYGNGEWNYHTNEAGLRAFWEDGFRRNMEYESIITMGMRGDGDMEMVDQGSAEKNFRLLERLIQDQRDIIEAVSGQPASEYPQLWALYKEVLEYYNQGMQVPDDMIILLCDDNWGDVERLPDPARPPHPGGYGMYYHVDYHGGPRSYQWLNMTQIPQMWEQLQLCHAYGVDKIWILNVGDLKANEYPMDFFLTMAWNPEAWTAENLDAYAEAFCEEQFGDAFASEAADILSTSCKYNSRVTAEMLDHRSYNLETGEFLQVRDAYLALEARALRLFLALPEGSHDAYRELILHPVQAMANLYDLYYAVAMNRHLVAVGDPKANDWADHAKACFQRDKTLTATYHSIAGGKWNHMMDQTHIGYTTWHEPRGGDVMPEVTYVNPEVANDGGYVFTGKNGVVVMEAEHYFDQTSANGTAWTVIPDMGRTLSGVALMPYTEDPAGAFLTYHMKLTEPVDSVTIRLILDSTLPFNGEGHHVGVSLDGAAESIHNINRLLTWEHNYTHLYPTAAQRIIEVKMTLPVGNTGDNLHEIRLRALDPGVVFHKVIVDLGGYEPTRLFMQESPYSRKIN